MAEVLRVDPRDPAPGALDPAAALLRAGGLVAFPTETVYGLGADALDPSAVARIFTAKGRPPTHPLIVHLASAERPEVDRVVADWSPTAERLARAFWPGPLTLILPAAKGVPRSVTGGLATVGVRVPAHPVAQALLRAVDRPLAAPSANPYTGVSPTTAEHVLAGLGERIEMIVDGGPTPVGIESTVLDLTASPPRLLRPGSISIDQLRRLIGEVERGGGEIAEEEQRASPGMAARHYAPHARLLPLASRTPEDPRPTGAIVIHADPPTDHLVRLPDDPEGYSRMLYAALHEMDSTGVRTLYFEPVPVQAAWEAVRDRLGRATAAPD